MTKRIAAAELNQDNWKEEDVPEERGLFQKASHSELKMRPMMRARRRALASDGPENASVFKSFKAFSSKPSEISPAVFSFLSDNNSKPQLSSPTPATSLNFSNKNSPLGKDSSSNTRPDDAQLGFAASADKESESSRQSNNLKFSFGSGMDKATNPSKQADNFKFSFGASPNKETTSSKQPNNLEFNFGANADKQTILPNQPDNFKFKFGASTDKLTNSTKKVENLKFSFGANTDKESNKSQSQSSDNSNIKDLVKANNSAPSKNVTDNTTTSSSQFKFSFSTKETDSEKSQPMFKFGINSQDKTSEPSVNSSFNFGNSEEKNSISKTSKPVFKLGIVSDQVESNVTSSPSAMHSKNTIIAPSVSVISKIDENNSHNTKKNSAHNGLESNITGSSKEPTSNKFLMKLKALNHGVLKWVNQHVDKNPYINLKPIFDDYDKHFQELKKKYSSSGSESHASPSSLGARSNHKQTDDLTHKSTANIKSNTVFKFGSSTSESKSELFSFGTQKPSTSFKTGKDIEVKPFSFGVSSSASATSHQIDSNEPLSKSSTNSIPLVEDKPASFSFGSTEKKPTFSFGSPDNCTNNNSNESLSKASNHIFSFGGQNKSASFSFSSTENSEKKPFTFGSPENSAEKNSGFSFGDSLCNKPLGFSFKPPGSTDSSSTMADEKKDTFIEECPPSDEVPQVEVAQVKEDDAVYEKKVKLFYKKDRAYVDKGVGTLYLKLVDNKTQLLIRALTTVGTILLNIILSESLPTQRIGKNNVLIVCIPNPPLDSNSTSLSPVSMLLKVKTESEADELLEKINKYKK